jgi:hypothetical protein
MTIFTKTLLPFVGSNLMSLSFFTARHNFVMFLKMNELLRQLVFQFLKRSLSIFFPGKCQTFFYGL